MSAGAPGRGIGPAPLQQCPAVEGGGVDAHRGLGRARLRDRTVFHRQHLRPARPDDDQRAHQRLPPAAARARKNASIPARAHPPAGPERGVAQGGLLLGDGMNRTP